MAKQSLGVSRNSILWEDKYMGQLMESYFSKICLCEDVVLILHLVHGPKAPLERKFKAVLTSQWFLLLVRKGSSKKPSFLHLLVLSCFQFKIVQCQTSIFGKADIFWYPLLFSFKILLWKMRNFILFLLYVHNLFSIRFEPWDFTYNHITLYKCLHSQLKCSYP